MPKSRLNGPRPLGRAAWALFVGGFVTFSLLYSVQPLLPSFCTEFRVGPPTASLALSVSTGALAFSMLAAAALSDRRGRKPVMSAALVVSSVLALLVPLAQEFASLLAFRLLLGIALAGLPAIAMAYLAEEIPPGQLGFAMGLYISGNAIGGMSGRLVIGLLSGVLSWRAALVTLAVICLAGSVWFARNLPPSRHFRVASPTALESLAAGIRCLRDPGLVCLYGIGALLMGSFVTLYNYIAFSLMGPPHRLSQAQVSWIFLNYLVGTFASTAAGRVADRVGRRRVLWLGVAVQAAGAVVTLGASVAVKVAGVALFTFGFFSAHSIASSWVGRRSGERKATASTLYLLSYYSGGSVGGWLGGHFWSGSGWPGVIAMITLCLGAALSLSAVLARIPPVAAVSSLQETARTGPAPEP